MEAPAKKYIWAAKINPKRGRPPETWDGNNAKIIGKQRQDLERSTTHG